MKNIFKKLLYALIWVFLFPFFVWERLPFSEYNTFTALSQLLAMVPGVLGIYLRRVWYKHTLKKCGENLTVDWMAVLRSRDSEIGSRCTFGVFSWIGWVTIGDDVMTGSGVVILSGNKQHNFSNPAKPIREQIGTKTKVVIGSDVWIGAESVIMTDVLGGTVIGAAAVVTKTFEKNKVLVGNPAKILKDRGSYG